MREKNNKKSDNCLLSIQEAAKILGIKPITLRKWDRENKLKPIRVGPRGDRKYYENDLRLFLEKSQSKKIEWQEYIRGGATYHIMPSPIKGAFEGFKKVFGRGIKNHMIYFEGNTLYWYYDFEDIVQFGRLVTDKLVSSKEFSESFFVGFNQKSDNLLNFVKEYNLEKMKTMSDKELAEMYSNFDDQCSAWYGYSAATDGTDESMMIDISDRIRKVIKNKLKDKYDEREFTRAYGILTQPSKFSYLTEEKIMELKLLKDIKDKKIEEGSREYQKKIKEIADKFWWTGLGWARDKIKDEEFITSDLKEIKESGADVAKELEKIFNYEQRIKKEKDEVDKKYNYRGNELLAKWLDLFDGLVECHDIRKEVQMKVNYWNYQFLEEVGKRKRVPVSLLDWCDIKEINNLLLNNEFNETELNLRSSNFLQIRINNEVRSYSGKKAVREHQEIIDLNIEETRDLQGICASGGKVIGEAYVAITVNSALKINEGQVLVTGMTTPDFLPAMKKAQAIITDEGGITCHAAIVSREFGIPCIVGTKYATKLIKSGDLLEVKANHSVVRILKKAK